MPSSRGFFQPRDRTQVSCIADGFFTIWVTREACVSFWCTAKWFSYTYIYMCVYMCMYTCMCACSDFSPVWLFATLWTVAHQALLSPGFSKQKYWSGLPCPPPGDLPDPGIEPESTVSPALRVDSLPLGHQGSPCAHICICVCMYVHTCVCIYIYMKGKSLSRVWLLPTPWTAAYQPPPSMDFPGKSTGVGCHCLLQP